MSDGSDSGEQNDSTGDRVIGDVYTAVRGSVTGTVDVEGALEALHRRTGGRVVRHRSALTGVAVAAVVAVLGLGVVLLGPSGNLNVSTGGDTHVTTTPPAGATTSVPCAEAGSRIYLKPVAGAGEVPDGATAILNVVEPTHPDEIVLIGRSDSYEEFKLTFASDPQLVGSVRPEDLSTSITVRPALDESIRASVAAMPEVQEIKPLEPSCGTPHHDASERPPFISGPVAPQAACAASPIPEPERILSEPFHVSEIGGTPSDDRSCMRSWAVAKDAAPVSGVTRIANGPTRSFMELGPDTAFDPRTAKGFEFLGTKNGWTVGRAGEQMFVIDPTAKWRLQGNGFSESDWRLLAGQLTAKLPR